MTYLLSNFALVRRAGILIFSVFAFFKIGAQSRLYFTPNAGQWEENFVARSIFRGGAFFLRQDGFWVKMISENDLPNIHKAFHYRGIDTQFTIHGHNLDFQFLGSQKNCKAEFSDEADWYENYYLGADTSRWKTGIYPAGKIKLENVYPGISLLVYTHGEQIEYDWIVAAGADPSQIKILVRGATGYRISEGICFIQTSVGELRFNNPMAFQQADDKIPVYSSYKLNGDTLSVQVGNYNHKEPLIIDPVLIFSTYSGSRGDNFGFTATYDTSGHLYAAGIIDNAQGAYPVTAGAFQTTYGGRGPAAAPVYLPCDVSISKYKPDGSALVYASYLGGKSNEYPHSLGIDEKNNLLVFGTTLSSNFPLPRNTAFDSGYNGAHDIYIVKISSDGKKMLAGTYLGGSQNDGINTGNLHYNYADDFRGDIICDVYGNIYITTCTRSSNFPVSSFAQQKAFKGNLEGAVVSLKGDLSALRWSTFVGGASDDAGYSIKLDDSSHIFVSGGTASTDFPIVGNALYSTYQGGKADGFVLKMTSDSGYFLTSTFWGTPKYEQAYFLDFDIDDKIYITGQTEGTITRTFGTYGKDNTTQFIARLNNNLDTEEFATTFGNRSSVPELSPCAFMVDKCYNIYFSGWGSAVGVGNAGTTNGLEISPNAIQKTTDDNDFYLIVLGRDAKTLMYATYFGGDSSEDHVDGGTSRFDKRGIIYQSVCSSCPPSPPGLNDFPTTPGSAFPVNVSYRCSNASFKFDFKITYAVEAKFTADPLVVCTPDTVFFYQSSSYGKTFVWDFGDGTKSNKTNPYHLYTSGGTFKVKFKVIDSGSCNITDSQSLNIKVLIGPELHLDVTTEPCNSEVKFHLSGKNYASPNWDLGDNTKASGDNVNHSYLPGNYTAKVVAANPATGCKDSISTKLSINKDSLNDIFLANVFTPNNDGKNDCYRVIGLSKDCENAELKIFNRWGERIFETKDLSQCWNGTVDNKGVLLPEGTYFYQLFIHPSGGQKRLISGSINLIR